VQDGCNKVSLVPVFLGQGGHVLRDLPLLVDELRGTHPGLDITVAPAVGEDAAVLDAIARYCVSTVERA
jgi:sirohydrochlorin cobaltochelatase